MGEKSGTERAGVMQPPTGTRDFYPAEMLRRRYVEKAWRDVSLRHAFEEIDGPTFEHLDLYTIKSGEGIVSELFSFERFGGEKKFALRAEFTPTLARMYAARANSLGKPTRWFWQSTCFRAERPQRGRLREFLQWNCDVMGLPGGEDTPASRAAADAEVISCCVAGLEALGLSKADVRVLVNDRFVLEDALVGLGVARERAGAAFGILDAMGKLPAAELIAKAKAAGVDAPGFVALLEKPAKAIGLHSGVDEVPGLGAYGARFAALREATAHLAGWIDIDFTIARGLAYYTGMVFEVHEASGAERAIAGGGRYDSLIELFGGPATPAVGFGMGDVVLSLVLADRKLLPEGKPLLDALSRPGSSLRPDAFVISAGNAEADAAVKPMVAELRRAGLHARHTSKTTKNIGKILQEAGGQAARFAVIVESAGEVVLKNLDTNEQDQHKTAAGELAAELLKRLGR